MNVSKYQKNKFALQKWPYYGIIRPLKGAEIMPQIIPIRDLKNTSEISALCRASAEPIFITKNGYGDMVIMSMETYEKYLYLQDVYTKLDTAEKDIAEGRTRDARESLRTLRQKHGI